MYYNHHLPLTHSADGVVTEKTDIYWYNDPNIKELLDGLDIVSRACHL